MIQIIAQRAFNGSERPVFVYTEPPVLLPSLQGVFSKFHEVLAALPESEHYNLFYTLAHHSGVTGASKPQRTAGTFEFQTVLAFDIDADPEDGTTPDVTRALEYAAIAGKLIQAPAEAFTVVTSGNGIHLIWGLRHPIRKSDYFDEERAGYKEILKRLKIELRAVGLGGAGDPKIFDPARVLRLPGTRNIKPGRDEKSCAIVQLSKHQLETDLFKLSGLRAREKDNVSPGEIRRNYPAPDFAEMVRECHFVKWAISEPNKVHEPQFFDLASLLAPQMPDAKAETPYGILGPRALAERVFDKALNSASLKKEDFNSKWEQAKEYGGRKCQTIHNSWIGGCEKCPHWEKIPTPLALRSKDHIGTAATGFWVYGAKGQHLHPHYEDLAKVFRAENDYIVTEDERVMRFNGQFYVEYPEIRAKVWIEDKMNPSEPVRENMRMEFVKKIHSRVGINGLAAEEFFELTTKNRLNCANGVLDVVEGRLLPSSSDYGFKYVLPYAVDLNDPGSELFLDWLATITENRPELMESILDIMAYALWPNYDDHLFAYFVGTGANGKSTLIHLIQAIVGAQNFATVGIQQLGSNRFAPAQLEGKLVNLSEESSGGGQEMDHEAMNVIKNLSAGGSMMIERKGKDGYSFTNKAKLIFSANQAPKFRETGHAIQRRMLVIPFDYLIEKPDKRIEDQLISEVPKIAAMLVRRIQEKLRAEGKFIVARGGAVAESAKLKVIYGHNTAVEWGEECIESGQAVGEGKFLRVDEAYNHYRQWCESNGFAKPLSKPAFGRVVRAMVISPLAGDTVVRQGSAVHRVYRYTKFKEGMNSYGPAHMA